jgi:hypothetical protein
MIKTALTSKKFKPFISPASLRKGSVFETLLYTISYVSDITRPISYEPDITNTVTGLQYITSITTSIYIEFGIP